MPKTPFIALFLGALLLASPATAAGPCPASGESALVSMNSSLFVGTDGHVYQESNTVPGLQRLGGSCVDETGQSRTWPADTRLA